METCPHELLRKIEVVVHNHQSWFPTLHAIWCLIWWLPDLPKSMVMHDTECPYWDKVSLNNTKSVSSFFPFFWLSHLSSVTEHMCTFDTAPQKHIHFPSIHQPWFFFKAGLRSKEPHRNHANSARKSHQVPTVPSDVQHGNGSEIPHGKTWHWAIPVSLPILWQRPELDIPV